MKIEKLTDNKIRVIANCSDLKLQSFDVSNIFPDVLQNSDFFPSLLEKADEQVGFNTDGCKLIIEAISCIEDIFVFTITKYSLHSKNSTKQKNAIYAFSSFDEFCYFCERLSNLGIKRFCKNVSLYFYNNTYFLLATNILENCEFFKIFNCIACEFATLVDPFGFENKLFEYGDIVIKNNAILTGIKYFT